MINLWFDIEKLSNLVKYKQFKLAPPKRGGAKIQILRSIQDCFVKERPGRMFPENINKSTVITPEGSPR